jgi:hypothetical protein
MCRRQPHNEKGNKVGSSEMNVYIQFSNKLVLHREKKETLPLCVVCHVLRATIELERQKDGPKEKDTVQE